MQERSFILKQIPMEARRWKTTELHLGWLPSGERELCLLRSADACALVLAQLNDANTESKAGGQNSELNGVQIPLRKEQYDTFWPETAEHRLQLLRQQGRLGKFRCTIDRFQGDLAGLDIVRVAGPHMLSHRVQLNLDCLGIEIGYDSRFDWPNLAGGSINPELTIGINENRFAGAIGALPYVRNGNDLKILLCTTQRRERWIFPKGQVKAGLAWKDVALMEAAEEAGLIGEITGEPILCSYNKSSGPVDMILFPMEVKSMLKVWQESETRERSQFLPAELADRNDIENLAPGLLMIERIANTWK